MLNQLSRIVFLSVLLSEANLVAGAGSEFHVSLSGNDTSVGTAAAPFRTLNGARDTIRAMRSSDGRLAGGVAVIVHGGTYRLPEPFELGLEDGGTAASPVVYRAADGEAVWLSGGMPLRLADFRPVTDQGILKRLPEERHGRVSAYRFPAEQTSRLAPPWPDTWWTERNLTACNELFSDGRRLPLARWPNRDYTTFGEIVQPAHEADEMPQFKYLGERPERWNVGQGVWLYGYWRRGYRAEFIRVGAIDRQEKTIRLAARNSLGNLDDGGANRYFAVNLLDELDAPGEWFLDRDGGTLYLIPPARLQDDHVTLSVNSEAVIRCAGTQHVEFHGFGIECSARDGVRIEGGSDCRVVGCEIRNVAFTGVAASGDRHQIVGCDIHDTGNIGVSVKSGDRRQLTRGDSVVDNCHIHHTNRIVRAGSKAVSFDGVGIRVSHNLIHDVGYIAVGFLGNDHVMEFNRLFRTNDESSEGGVFYTGRDWTSRGSVIRYNFIHHVEDSREGCGSSTRFVHLDDSAPETEIFGNVCYRLGGGVSVCGGAANHVHDNLFVECHWGVDVGPRGEDMFESDGKGGFRLAPNRFNWSSLVKRLKTYPWNEPPYSTKYPKLAEIFTKSPIAAPWFNVVERNVMVDCGYGVRKGAMKPEWSTFQDNWEGSDPGFVEPDHAKLDFRLASDGVVCREIDFQGKTPEKIGLYESPERRTWPVELELPPDDWKPRWMRLREQASKSLGRLPVYKAVEVTGKIAIDGKTSVMEWTPGDATGSAPEIHETAELKWTRAGKTAKRPSRAMLQTDDEHLYVQFHNDVDPDRGVTGGHQWDRDDAVEIAVAEVGAEVGSVLILRGYPDGFWQATASTGTPPSIVERLRSGGVQYAANVVGRGLWTAEWKIPFDALGLAPPTRNPRLAFNLSVRKPADGELVMLQQGGGETWDVTDGTLLWLAQFGEMAVPNLKPSNAVIHILSLTKTGQMLEPIRGCEVCDWAKPKGHRLSASARGMPTDSWQELSFSFVSTVDGDVSLILLGDGYTDPFTQTQLPVWVYMDDLRAEGAELVNGDFEEREASGEATAWRPHVNPATSIRDPKLAASGSWLIKVAHDRRFAQTLRLTAGQAVTVRAKVRGLPVQGAEMSSQMTPMD